MKKAISTYYFFIPLLLLCIFYAYKAIDFPIHDFSNYYFGGKLLAQGNFDPQIYFPYQFNQAILASGNLDIFASYAPNTPFLAWFFVPFSLVSVAAAKLIFNVISIGLFIFSIYRLITFYKISLKFVILLPVLFLVPIKNNLLFGQVYFLVFFLLAEGWIGYEEKRWKSMAFFWALAILLKVFPAILILLLIFRKQWKPVFYLGLSCVLLFGISIIFTGIEVWAFYLKHVLPKSSDGEIATAFVDNYQSVFMFLKRLFVYESSENPNAFFHAPIWFWALVTAFKIGCIALGFFITRNSGNKLQVFSFWILAMILLSPYGSTYTLILLVFLFFALLKIDISNTRKAIICLIVFLFSNVPLSLFIDSGFPVSYARMFLLLLLFVLFLIPIRKEINWKMTALSFVIPMIPILIFKKIEPEKSAILLEDAPILIYDYKIETNPETNYTYLKANFWDGKEKILFWKGAIHSFELLKLKNNQVFYKNRQLTFDQSHKLKPMLIDGKTIIFLSDYGRGIGFYTLRKIDIK